MLQIQSDDLAMTFIEQQFKEMIALQPSVTKKILSADELTDYLRWLMDISQKNGKIKDKFNEVSAFPNITRLSDVAKYRQSISAVGYNPQQVPAHRETISENQEILANHDISVGRVIRYYPAHWHSNDSFEIYYALSGSCPVYFKDEIITVKPGTVLIISPSVVHATPCYSDDNVLLYFLVRSSTFEKVFWNQIPEDNLMSAFFRQALSTQQTKAYLHFETDNDPDIQSLLYRIYQEYRHEERYGSQMLNALMNEFFVLLLRRYEGSARLPRTKDFYWKHEFSAILTYIQTNYATATQEDVASHFHYSARQIGRIVQNCTGMTYAQLILKLRMERASTLLLRQNSSIDSIAAAIGYSTSCSFYRAFSQYYGCTPRAYLKANDE